MEIESLAAVRIMPEKSSAELKTQEAGKPAADVELNIKKSKTDEEKLKTNSAQKDEEKQVDKKILALTIEEANKRLSGVNREFQYSVHEKTNKIMVKILDKDTKEVIREIPPEKTLDIVGKIWEMAGILVDEKK